MKFYIAISNKPTPWWRHTSMAYASRERLIANGDIGDGYTIVEVNVPGVWREERYTVDGRYIVDKSTKSADSYIAVSCTRVEDAKRICDWLNSQEAKT